MDANIEDIIENSKNYDTEVISTLNQIKSRTESKGSPSKKM